MYASNKTESTVGLPFASQGEIGARHFYINAFEQIRQIGIGDALREQ
jgi:hypothetical protein